jgi:hypothetical protein
MLMERSDAEWVQLFWSYESELDPANVDYYVAPFARAVQAEERARIVRWVRNQAVECSNTRDELADQIEKGEV